MKLSIRSGGLRPWRRLLMLALWALGDAMAAEPATAKAKATAWMGVDSARLEWVTEPVYGGKVAVYSAGQVGQPTVVLIHGLGSNGATDWAELVPALAAQYHVIAVDQPGFGKSDRGNHLYSPDNQAAALAAVLAQLKVERHFLIGHSFGAAVALAYAGAHPQQVERLILVDMAGVLHRSVYTEYLSRMGALYFTGVYPQENSLFGGLVREALRTAERWVTDSGWALESPWFRQQVLQGDSNAIAAYALVEQDFGPLLDRLTAPTLLIWGRDDPLAPLRTGQAVASRLAGSRLVVMDGIGHSPMFEAPDEFRALVKAALAGQPVGDTVGWTAPPSAAPRMEQCAGLARAHFTGVIAVLKLENCGEVRIERARIGRLEAINSRVRMVDTQWLDGGQMRGGFLQMTGGHLNGPVALHSANADLAGVQLAPAGQLESHGTHRVAVHYSISRREAGSDGRPPERLHGTRELAPGQFW